VGYDIQQGNLAEPLRFLMISAADHITGVTGLVPGVTLTVTILKSNQASFAAPAGAVTETGNGWYQIQPNALDASTLGVLTLHAVGTNCDPTDDNFDVVNFNPNAFTPTVVTAPTAVAGVSFGQLWRKMRLYVPGAPVFLVKEWVEHAFKSIADRRGWVFMQSQGQITWDDNRPNLAVTLTRGSRTVTSVGLFSSADVGRQFAQGTYPIYTIVACDNANQITLNEPYYGLVDGAVTDAQILDAYAVMPANFSQFLVVCDPVNQRLIPWWATQEEITLVDPTRTSADSVPRLLVASSPSTNPATLGQMTYEYWPKPTAQGALQYYSWNRPVALRDDTIFRGVLGTRPDILLRGAQAQAALWPGTADRKNPYFNIALASHLDEQFEQLITQIDLRDDDQSPQSWETIPWARFNQWAWAYNTHLLQRTDATLADYAGYYGSGG
jgi:hypothetical protein